jgi:toxin-antitoxin system PIN domain toxin
VIALDTNILVYAHREDSNWHEPAFRSLTGLAAGKAPWAIPWPCIHEFLAIVTHPRIYRPPTPLDIAIDQANAWLEAPNVRMLSEVDGYWSVLSELVIAGRIVGPQVHDARIAALCIHHGVDQLWSADRDFSRFPSLRVRNPLIQ